MTAPGGMTAAGGRCSGPSCLTCSDRAVAATVRRLLPDAMALVDAGGEGTDLVSVALVGAAVGDVVLVHAGEALAVVTG